MSSSSSSSSSSIDPKNGFCSDTKIFHSLRPPVPLPPLSQPHSITSYCLSLLPSPLSNKVPALVDSSTSVALSFSDYVSQIQSLAFSLQTHLGLTKGHVAFILSPTRIEIPILYFALLSLGVVITPSNPLSSVSEISHQFSLSKPTVAFSVSSYAPKLPTRIIKKLLLIDSDSFQSFLLKSRTSSSPSIGSPTISQSDPAAILYSSGTTGRVKGVVLSHRNFIAIAAAQAFSPTNMGLDYQPVSLFTIPLFHVFGMFMLMKAMATAETAVIMGGGFMNLEKMLRAVEKFTVTVIPMSPPLVLAMTKSDIVEKFDLRSLRRVACGGAPLGKEVALRFIDRFPGVEIVQGYGLTESTGGSSATSGPEENRIYGSAGRLNATLEAKIVDPVTGESLGPGQQGELWMRGPTIMKGYVGDDQATESTLTSEGWLKTGDLCYFDHDGFLFIVDRLKELIKYKAYQVPPAELEHILNSHPGIADAAVIPYPDEDAGEIPMAFVVRQSGSKLGEGEVMDFVAKQVAPYKKIRRVAFVSSIPKSPAGKILRRELINQLRCSKSTSKL